MQKNIETPLVLGVLACVSSRRETAQEIHEKHEKNRKETSWIKRGLDVSLSQVEWALHVLVQEKKVKCELTRYLDCELAEDTKVFYLP